MTVLSETSNTRTKLPDKIRGESGRLWDDLEAARRIDWQFLLPEPRLGSVAYLGPKGNPLYNSLCRFSDSLTAVDERSTPSADCGTFDVVVCTMERQSLVQAAQLVRSGGFLYAEWDRSSDRRLGRSPRHHARILHNLGLRQAALHWHWPNFESCLEMVRLDDRVALEHVMARRGSGFLARAKAGAGRLLIRTGLFPRVVRCVSLLAERTETSGISSLPARGAARDV